MIKARFGPAVVLVALAAVALLAAATLAASPVGATTSNCASSGKCYLADVTPANPVAGTNQAFTITVTNEANTQQLGSLQVTAPSGYVVTGASGGTSGGTASYTSGSALFLSLGLGPGQSAALTVDATAPCGGPASSWGIEAKQSNQFNGSGNDFQLDPASSLSVTVSGSCSLAFVNEPNGTLVDAPITTLVRSAGSPVSVEVLGGTGLPLATSTAAVTVAIGFNPGSGTLSGTTTVDASGGVASFPGLSIDQAGTGYTLVATSPGMRSGTSVPFDIWDVLQSCSGGSCSGSSSTETTTGTVTTPSAPSGDFLGVGLGGATFSCDSSYQPLSDPLSFGVLSISGVADAGAAFTNSLEVAKNVVQSSGHLGASTWQICYASEQPFTAVPGTAGSAIIGGVTYHTGLLADCSSTQPAPCVQARNKDNAGDVVITFLAFGDPFART